MPETPSSQGWVSECRRVGKSWLRRGLEAGDRLMLRLDRALLRRGRPRIAAAVTGRFPLYFHTFAYQELLALHEMMGADVKVFHLLDGDRAALDPAFDAIVRRATRLPNAREISRADLAHYRQVAGDRVRAVIDSIAAASGLAASVVEQDDAVLRAFSFARKVELYGADYIHTFFFYGESLGGLVAQQMLGIPRGVTAYADHVLQDWHLKVVPLHLATADVVVATSERIRDELVALGGPEHADKILVKPNGVDGRRFPYRERVRKPGEPVELISVSRLEPKKGLLELVDVAEIVRRCEFPVHFHLVGTTDPGRAESQAYARGLREKIESAGLGDMFVLHGRKTQLELLPLLHRAHAFVAPYLETAGGDKDGVPTAMLEAMSTGLPVLATDAGSIPEVIDDGVEGRVLAQRDAPAMAEAIAELVAGPEPAVEMGHRARDRFERQFDARVTEGALHDRLRELFGARPV